MSELASDYRENKFPVRVIFCNSLCHRAFISRLVHFVAQTREILHNLPNGKLLGYDNHPISPAAGRSASLCKKALRPDATSTGVGVRFIVDLEAGKPTVRLDSVMRVLSALGGVINLDGLPSSAD